MTSVVACTNSLPLPSGRRGIWAWFILFFLFPFDMLTSDEESEVLLYAKTCSSAMAYSAVRHSGVAYKSGFGILKGEEPELFELQCYKPSTPLVSPMYNVAAVDKNLGA
ncbi:hypothetical protein H0G86_009534 [Trichoderma simmonsii]|uniref:Uncharacterized protein n=1 Tax=Trichoderma simmonsii TaxID=1491479 RepID=A0A8G0LHS3_9HYPO|nr:hypothetical protein H0G86_009534 [Trichoderma simmonsii]